MLTWELLCKRVATQDRDLSSKSVECGVELYLSENFRDVEHIAVARCLTYARAMERRAELERRELFEENTLEERVERARPAPAKGTTAVTIAEDLAPLGNIMSRELAKAKRASVEQARLELWGNTSAIAVTLASALQWRAEAASATVQLLTAKATTMAADAGGTVSVWETHLLTDALYISAMAIEVSRHGSILYFPFRGLAFKQVERVLKVNSEVFDLLPERSRAVDEDDDRFLAMVERLGGPPPEGKKEAWWGNVFIPGWNVAGLKLRYDDWHEPYQRHQRLVKKLRLH